MWLRLMNLLGITWSDWHSQREKMVSQEQQKPSSKKKKEQKHRTKLTWINMKNLLPEHWEREMEASISETNDTILGCAKGYVRLSAN